MQLVEIPNDLLQSIKAAGSAGRRKIICIVGPPASGKSTFADALVKKIGPSAITVPMDGFHLNNSVLETMGLLQRKGAPESFDVEGLCSLVQLITKQDHVFFPTFDRATDSTIARSGVLTKTHKTVVLEGNYLLLDAPNWRDINHYCDFSVFLDVPREIVEQRLVARWQGYGFKPKAIQQKVHGNDLLNYDRIYNGSLSCDYRLAFKQE